MKRGTEENNNQEISPRPTQSILKISTGDMSGGEIFIPVDITVEILKKLPSKSLVRFRCVSKQWSSIISYNKDFIDSIVTRALTQPQRYHAIFEKKSSSRPYFEKSSSSRSYFFNFSSTDPTIINTESVAIPGSTRDAYNCVRGLVLCWSAENSSSIAIYNPTTRQSLYLPEMKPLQKHERFCLFGYDPIEDQYKVLYLLVHEQSWHVFTLRGPKKWRKIKGPRLHSSILPTVCIDGVIYYRSLTINECDSTYVPMSFDVKSEKFDQVQTPKKLMTWWPTLIDYQGKLGFVCCCKKGIEIWVMENVETKKWFKIFFNEMEGFEAWSTILSVTRGGEIVFIDERNNSTKVLYYDPKRNCMRSVQIEDPTLVEFKHSVRVVLDHVENTMSLN